MTLVSQRRTAGPLHLQSISRFTSLGSSASAVTSGLWQGRTMFGMQGVVSGLFLFPLSSFAAAMSRFLATGWHGLSVFPVLCSGGVTGDRSARGVPGRVTRRVVNLPPLTVPTSPAPDANETEDHHMDSAVPSLYHQPQQHHRNSIYHHASHHLSSASLGDPSARPASVRIARLMSMSSLERSGGAWCRDACLHILARFHSRIP
jgi:hypothetical protein